MPPRKIWKLVLLLSTVTACSTQPSTQDLTKELKTVTSWAATARVVGNAWLKGDVPNVYAQQTLQTTQKELHKEIDTLAKVAPVQNRSVVLDRVQQLQQTVIQMTAAIDQKDRAVIAQDIQELSQREQAIRTLVKGISQQP